MSTAFKQVTLLLIILICLVSMFVYTMSGILIFLGIVVLIESVPTLRWIVTRTSNILDILIFVFSVAAMASMSVTISIGLSIAGLLFTVYYKPYVVANKSNNNKAKEHNYMK